MKEDSKSVVDPYLSRTRSAYVWTRILDTPFWGIFNLLPIILYKDLHATPFQLGLVITLKPLVSILSSYWPSLVQRYGLSLVPSIAIARLFAYLPFLLFPFIQDIWYLISCFGIFMFLQAGMMPAWMELLKQNLPDKTRDKVFSYTQAFGYLGGGLIPLAIGWMLDEWVGIWRWLFPCAALIGLLASFAQRLILVRSTNMPDKPPNFQTHPLFQPWKSAWDLLKRRPDFAKFQIGFMMIGCGLMVLQPSLPVFFVDNLNLSYTEIGVAITLCKGVGFAAGSPLWVRWMQRVNLFQFGALIASLAALFTLFLLAAQTEVVCLFFAYIVYGLMQAGNELSWNLSGPIFARNEDSSPFSSVNVMAVGVRGIFIPTFGAFCLAAFGSSAVITISAIFFVLASWRMSSYGSQMARTAQS
jgi:MFS family permease